MSMIQIRRSLVASAMLATVAAFAPAHAGNTSFQPAGVQILDPSGVCASWTLGGTAALPTLTCIAAVPPVAGSPVCSITANTVNPLNISASGPVALSATCTNTDALTTWDWTASPAAPAGFVATTGPGGTPQVQALTVGVTTTFGVIATNATGPSANKTVKVTVGAPPPPPPPPPTGGAIDCKAQGFARTITLDLKWVPPQQTLDTAATGFADGDIVVARFTTPATLLNSGAGTNMNVVEFIGSFAIHTMSLSTVPCDFTSTSVMKLVAPQGHPSIGVKTSAPSTLLTPSTTYYLNVTNTNFYPSSLDPAKTVFPGTPTCNTPGVDCSIAVTLKPN